MIFNCRHDPAGWNLDDKPKDNALLTFLSFAVDECCNVDSDIVFCVFPAASVVENMCMEGGGIDLTRENLWDYRSANARAVLGFMEGHWSIMHPKSVPEFCEVSHSKCALFFQLQRVTVD